MWARKFGPCIVWARLCGPECCVGQAMRPWMLCGPGYAALDCTFISLLTGPVPTDRPLLAAALLCRNLLLLPPRLLSCPLSTRLLLLSSPLRAPSRGPQMVRWVRSQMERIGAAFSRGGQSTLILHTVCCVLAVLCCTFLVTQTITSALSSVASAFLAPCSLSC